jgi:Bifunctional DNA primase/polymerase, N-terminal
MQLLTETSCAYDSTNLAIAQVLNVADHRHAEAARLLSAGLKLCALHQLSKRPVGESWQVHPVTEVLESVGGYGVLLAANNLCSIDPDNEDAARAGLLRCGFDLEEIMAAGVRTSSTRPGSGGRSTFKAPPGARWIKFSDKKQGTLLELRAESSNLQDCLPGTTLRN